MKPIRKMVGLLILLVMTLSVYAVSANAAVSPDEISKLNDRYDLVFQINLDRGGNAVIPQEEVVTDTQEDIVICDEEETAPADETTELVVTEETPIVVEPVNEITETVCETPAEESEIPVEPTVCVESDAKVVCPDAEPTVTQCVEKTPCPTETPAPVCHKAAPRAQNTTKSIPNTGDAGLSAIAAVSAAASAAYILSVNAKKAARRKRVRFKNQR